MNLIYYIFSIYLTKFYFQALVYINLTFVYFLMHLFEIIKIFIITYIKKVNFFLIYTNNTSFIIIYWLTKITYLCLAIANKTYYIDFTFNTSHSRHYIVTISSITYITLYKRDFFHSLNPI